MMNCGEPHSPSNCGKKRKSLNFECNKADIAADNKNYAAAGCTEKAAKTAFRYLERKGEYYFLFDLYSIEFYGLP
jgi:hypothetical protein